MEVLFKMVITIFGACFASIIPLESQTCLYDLNYHDLIIIVDGIEDSQGTLQICLASEKNQFLKDCQNTHSISVNGHSRIQIRLDSIPSGEYAVSVFHDLNSNAKLDNRNLLHLPKEPFGFSNNPLLVFGPPRFKDCMFRLDSDNQEIVIRLKRI